MSVDNLDKRVKELEGKLYDFTFPEGSTTFFHDGFTEKERLLIGRFWQLHEKYEDYVPDDVLKANHDLLEAVEQIYWLRFFDLFKTIVVKRICKTGLEEFRFYIEFFTLIHRLSSEFERNRLVDAKVKELFGNDPLWYSEDEDAIPDTDPRWKVLHDYEEELERKDAEGLERYRKEMVGRAFSSMDKGSGRGGS